MGSGRCIWQSWLGRGKGAHGKSPKRLDGNLGNFGDFGDFGEFGEFRKGLNTALLER